MEKIKTKQITKLNLKTKKEEITGIALINGTFYQLYKAEVSNGKVKII
ncbi:MAG: hypothetical protein Q4A00_07895 [Flavobacteriaceae bacterium]|nr:hypothetical protein [Flavobacteriaceae bacterium]